jgi:pimeloyl-ACP methyl ester carboxylesterase
MKLLGSLEFGALAAAARRVAVPALVFHCAEDHMVEREIARELVSLLPDGRLVGFAAGGHHLQKRRAERIATTVCASPDEAGEPLV